jgi:hypothetical protein
LNFLISRGININNLIEESEEELESEEEELHE